MQRVKRLQQSLSSPVDNVIVGEHAAVDSGRRQAGDVPRIHPVIDALRPRPVGPRDRRFQVDDPEIRSQAFENLQGVAPDRGERRRLLDASVRALGHVNIVERGGHVRFVEGGRTRVGQHLIDAPAKHNVSAKHQPKIVAGASLICLKSIRLISAIVVKVRHRSTGAWLWQSTTPTSARFQSHGRSP